MTDVRAARVFLLCLACVVGASSHASAQSFAVGRMFPTPVHPNAVAVGDFNEDGNQDLAVPCYSPNAVAIYLGNGVGGFGPSVSFAAGAGPRFAVVADFNNDGHQDIAVANQDSSDVAVLTGMGDGTFQPAYRVAAGLRPYHIAVSDLNADNRPDMIVANSASHTVSILIGTAGGFTNQSTLSVGTNPQGVVAGDFDRDGHSDFAVSNYGSHDVWLFRGDGAGGFSGASVFAVGLGPFTLAATDVNGDGRLDLAVPNFNSGTVSVMLGDAVANFVAQTPIPVGLNPRAVTIQDIDGDGELDLIVANWGSNTASILRGDGAGNFSTSGTYGVGRGPFYIAPLDANNDGITDLASADRDGFTMTLLIGRLDGTFAAPIARRVGAAQQGVVATDVNGDGKQDLVTANTAANSISVLLGTGDGTTLAPTTYASPGSPNAVVVADFNGDGRLDVASANSGTNSVTVLRADVSGGFLAATKSTAGSGPRALATGDFNADGRLDVATANYNGNTVGILLGNGAGGFSAPVALAAGSGPSGIVISDFDGNGLADIATANALSNSVSVFLATGSGTFAPALNFAAGTGAVAIAAADLDDDSYPDLAVANERANSVSVLRNDHQGRFVTLATVSVGERPLAVMLVDLTGDTNPELVVANSTSNTVDVFTKDENGNFAGRLALPAGSRPRGLSVADFDGDAQPDLAIANGNSHDTWLLLNRSSAIADLAISVTNAVSSVHQGDPISYTLTVSNAGPSAVNAVAVELVLPAGLTNVAVVAATGAFDIATGTWSGLDLPSGGQAALTVTGTVAASASGEFRLEATVSGVSGMADPQPSNNTGADVDTVIKGYADLTASITDGLSVVAAGDDVSYTIAISNAGPTAVENARVLSTAPASLGSLSWTCTGATGGTCPAAGSGGLDTMVDLPAGGTVTFVLAGTVAAAAPAGSLSVAVSVTAPADVAELDEANNSATDVNTLLGNSAPVSTPQSVTVVEDSSTPVTLSATDADGDSITYSIESAPQHGTLSGVAPSLTYTPTANYSGSDSFTFRASDGTLSSVATVTIAVTPVNDPPMALNQLVSAVEDVAIGLTLGAEDVDGDALTFTIVSGPARGTLTGTGAGRTYTPHSNLFGDDSFTFVVSDGESQSTPATVTLTVAAVNDAPIVVNPIADLAVNGDDASAALDVSSVFADLESGSALTLSVTSSDTSIVAAALSGSTLHLQLADRSGTATVTVRATDPAGAFAEDSLLVTLTRPLPAVSVADASRGEGGGVVFTLTLSRPALTPVTVGYTTTNATATAGADYVAGSGIVTFAAGVTSRSVTVATVGDVFDETDETFGLQLASPNGAVLGDAQAVGLIIDNDTSSLRVVDTSLTEGSGGVSLATFTVTLSTPSALDVSVDFATVIVNASALPGADFTARSGSLVFPAGTNATQAVVVEVLGDVIDEPNEAFSLALSNAVNASISRPVARGTIVDDDNPPSVSVDDVSMIEGASGTRAFIFTLTLSDVSGLSTRIRYQTADGTAVAGSDYTARSGEVVFTPGVTTRTISIAVTGDASPETDETFLVNLHTPVNLTIGDGQGTGTIETDDSES